LNIELTMATETMKNSKASTASSTKTVDKTFKAELEVAKTTDVKTSEGINFADTAETKPSQETKVTKTLEPQTPEENKINKLSEQKTSVGTNADENTNEKPSEETNTSQAKQIEDSNNEPQQAEILTIQQPKTARTEGNNTLSQQLKDKTENIKINKTSKNPDIEKPLNELTSKIASLKELVSTSKTDKTSDKDDYCQTITMDSNDITFFVNLVNNQVAQTGQGITISTQSTGLTDLTEVKSEATRQNVQVSATLMEALNKSFQTNKPFRIDFDSDVAVIMKVDKNGVLSANFIPGTAAVEAYLKNNISLLQQNFDNQNLPYNELAYSQQQKQGRKEQRNNKENEDE